MKYLLEYLSTVPDAPTVQDTAFQQLLVDVHAGKSISRSNEQFTENLEKIVNELRSSPEAHQFLKPVSKKEAPDYHEVIKHPMDLSTVLRNIKTSKYKSKAAFHRDLDLIWNNCLDYNAYEAHPIRATAKYMKQKADYLLEFLQDRIDRGPALLFPGLAPSPAPSLPSKIGTSAPSRGSAAGAVLDGQDEDEDAAGEDEDGDVDMEGYNGFLRVAGEGSRAGSSRGGSAAPRGGGQAIAALPFRDERPNLTPNLDLYPSFTRSANSMSHFSTLSSYPTGPSYSDKGKAKEIISPNLPPAWYPTTSNDQDAKLSASWWTAVGRDETYMGGVPSIAGMSDLAYRPQARIPSRRKRKLNAGGPDPGLQPTTSSQTPVKRTVKLERVVHRTVEELSTARKVVNSIQDWQRIEQEGGILPPIERFDREKALRREEAAERRRIEREEKGEMNKRRRIGKEVGETEAALACKRATAGMLAHAGFDGANEGALDLLTRISTEYMRNIGRTFRLLLDGFSRKMSSEDIILHSLFENGLVRPSDLETHIKDDIEREAVKIAEMARKVKQAYAEVTTAPVIEDDMMFADNGEMLTDGNFADELGEDFLGLRDLGIAREHGMNNLTIPTSLFYGRRKRAADATASGKADALDYALPPPHVPLTPVSYQSRLPALLHAFFASRIESGLGLEDDPTFEGAHAIIGSLGQVSLKPAPAATASKKKAVNGTAEAATAGTEKKKVVKKVPVPGVGKGNWIRPSKEERAKKLAEKNGPGGQQVINGTTGAGADAGVGENGNLNGTGVVVVTGEAEEEDAEGEADE